MAAFESSIEIDRSVDDVFAFLADPSNETRWQSGLIDSSFTSDGPLAVGSTGRDIRRSMGMKSTTQWVVTALVPNQLFAFKVTKPVPFDSSYRFEPTAAGVKVTMSVDPVGFTKVIWPIISGVGKKQYLRDFAKLKEVLESEPR